MQKMSNDIVPRMSRLDRSIEALLMKPHSILGAATRIGDSLTFFAENMASASRCTQITNLYIFGKPDEDRRRLDLLRQNIRKYGTISITAAAARKLEGVIKRKT
jgi:hypothetical protein